MKLFFGLLMGSLILGAAMWRTPQKIKTIIQLVMIAGICVLYFFTNQI